VSITVYEACACGASFTADGLVDHLDTRSALTEWRQEHQHDVTVSALRTEVERTLEYVRNADRRVIEADQRTDEARAAFHDCCARAEKAEAAVAHVRALCDEAGSLAFTGVTEVARGCAADRKARREETT
jgi:hypothetical protein